MRKTTPGPAGRCCGQAPESAFLHGEHGRRRRVRHHPRVEGSSADWKSQRVWSLHVTANWRLTFRMDAAEQEIYEVNYEDH
jgi:hypothetical protein